MDKSTVDKVLMEIRNRRKDPSLLPYLLPIFLLKPINPHKERGPTSLKIIQKIYRYRPIPYNLATRIGFYSLLLYVYFEVRTYGLIDKTEDGFLQRERMLLDHPRPLSFPNDVMFYDYKKDLEDYDKEQRLKFYNDLIEKQRNGLLKSKINFNELFDVNIDKQKDIKQEEEL
ncbi:hypothetical protein AKO1_008247 [Acrasis kona]|uniref:Uncharacterized protein n=1 Tax=Acrasis kona TaxID=1008807 RepID=A0AAW2YRQ6_9EUKA